MPCHLLSYVLSYILVCDLSVSRNTRESIISKTKKNIQRGIFLSYLHQHSFARNKAAENLYSMIELCGDARKQNLEPHYKLGITPKQ